MGETSFFEATFSFSTFYFLLFTFLFLAPGCGSKVVPEPRYLPAADLLDIVKDFQRLSREDLYRFPIPKDVTGINIMKATLVRLHDYEKKNPGQFSDIIQFNKAVAYERLREYDEALALYRKVAESDGRLGVEANKNIAALESFQQILRKPLATQDPIEYLQGLDEKVEAWNQIIHKYQGTPYEYLARVEEERIDRAKVVFVELNRHRMKDGNQLAIIGYGQLVTKHRHSKNLHRYLLDFGDFYTLLAKEYTFQEDPEGLTFDFDAFGQLAKSALKLYTEVAQVDGILEKIEAQGKIEALRGLLEKMRRLNR
jgi:tetratricopeptide (TPR) repeat protein